VADLPVDFEQNVKPVSPWGEAWRRLKKNRMAVFGLVVVLSYFAIALFADFIPFYPYDTQVIDHQNLPPSVTNAGEVMMKAKTDYLKQLMEAEGRTEMTKYEKKDMDALQGALATNPVHKRVYLAGTDELGRDLLSRTVYGGRVSMLVGLIGSLAAIFIGILVGAVAGYRGGKIDAFLMRTVDVIYGLPYMLLVIILMALFGRSMVNLFVAIALVSWLDVARVVRGQVMSLKSAEFIEAAHSMGARSSHVIWKHLVPNTLGILVVYATLLLPRCIISESFLSFLGLGVSAPLASWGSLVAEGVHTMETYPWELLVPALAMTLFLFAVNFLGDGLRDALDPKSKNRV
jgi:oligopeptide transport system permease protein